MVSKEALSLARRLAYQALARRDHSRLEIIEKLQRRGFDPAIVSSVVKGLEAENYLNDRLFAITWAQKAMEQKHLGPLALRTGLQMKGIDREVADEVLQRIYGGGEEESCAAKAIRKWLGGIKGASSAGFRSRLASYLSRKGFTPEVIEKVLKDDIE